MIYFDDLKDRNEYKTLICKKEEYLFLLSLKNETMMEAYCDFKHLIEYYGDTFYNDYEIHNLFFKYLGTLNIFYETEYKDSKMKTELTFENMKKNKDIFHYDKNSVTFIPVGKVYELKDRNNKLIFIHKSKRNKIQEITVKEYIIFDLFNEIPIVDYPLEVIYNQVFKSEVYSKIINSFNDFEGITNDMYNKKMIVDFEDNTYQLLDNHSFYSVSANNLINNYKDYDLSLNVSKTREKILIPLTRHKEMFLFINDDDISQTESYSLLKMASSNSYLIDVYFLKDLINTILIIHKDFILKEEYTVEKGAILESVFKKEIFKFIQYNLFEVVIN